MFLARPRPGAPGSRLALTIVILTASTQGRNNPSKSEKWGRFPVLKSEMQDRVAASNTDREDGFVSPSAEIEKMFDIATSHIQADIKRAVNEMILNQFVVGVLMILALKLLEA